MLGAKCKDKERLEQMAQSGRGAGGITWDMQLADRKMPMLEKATVVMQNVDRHTKTSHAVYLLPPSFVHFCPQPWTGHSKRFGFFDFLEGRECRVGVGAVSVYIVVTRLRVEVLAYLTGGSSSGKFFALALPLPLPMPEPLYVLSSAPDVSKLSSVNEGAQPLNWSMHLPSMT